MEEGEMGCYFLMSSESLFGMKKVLEMASGDGCPCEYTYYCWTVYLIKMVKLLAFKYILPQ